MNNDYEIKSEYIKGKNYQFVKVVCACGNSRWVYKANFDRGSILCKECSSKKMSLSPDMIGKKFGQLFVLSKTHSDGNNYFYDCICDCGIILNCNGSTLRRGKKLRCFECKRKMHQKIGHGKKGSSIWVIWMGIKARCMNPNNRAYKNYGARGIFICEAWKDFVNFYADMGDRPDGMQIDRINNDDGYYKENCRWVTPKENCSNRRKKSECGNKNYSK